MEPVVDVLSWIALVLGVLFSIVGGLGLLRLPDLYCRLHAAGITDTMGAGLVLGGLMLQAGPTLATVKLALILYFILVTSPTSTFALVRAAREHGVEPWLPDAEERPSRP